jgi:hypothetical protein
MSHSAQAAALACLVALLQWQPTASAVAPVEGRVSAVTLYRGQAQVTRTVPIEGGAGRLEVVVSKLPEQIEPNSLFAEGGDGVEIRAVRYRTRAVGEEPREEVRKLDDEISAVQQELDLTTKRQALLVKRTEYLAKLEGFVAPTAQSDLTKGVLDAEALERLTTFSFTQLETIAKEEVELAKQARVRSMSDLNSSIASVMKSPPAPRKQYGRPFSSSRSKPRRLPKFGSAT